ncbi:MAG: MBL fold metallo-hydrolase, partial [Gemmatimonadales bacterium]
MPRFLCTTCGTQYPDREAPPDTCVICAEERQYLGWQGQRWTTLAELRAAHQARIESEGPGLTGVGSRPDFAIGQRAPHLATASGGILWDCAALLDDTVLAALRERGGVGAIAISHPHFYTTMVEWSRALGAVPIYLNALDRPGVGRDDPAIVYWDGPALELAPG